MKTIEQFNEELYQKIYDTYFEDFKKIVLAIHEEQLDETQEIYTLVLNTTQKLHEGNFDFRYFYKETIEERDSIKKTIHEMVSKYELPEYKEINELYNDWRNMIHEIAEIIGKELDVYVQYCHKENIKIEELDELQKDLDELKELEKNIENI